MTLALSVVLRQRDRLRSRLVPLLGVAPELRDLTRIVRETLQVPTAAAEGSMKLLAGKPLEAAAVDEAAWRLAGNLAVLKTGAPVLPWVCQRADEWVPFEVLRLELDRGFRGDETHVATCRILAGSPAALIATPRWSHGLCRYLAMRAGFTRRRTAAYRYSHPLELVGLRMMGLASAEKSRTGPALVEYNHPGSMVTWNRRHLLRMRCRVGRDCPDGYEVPCHRCCRGYAGPDACPYAVRPATLETGACELCGREDVLFDPSLPITHCVGCEIKRRMQR